MPKSSERLMLFLQNFEVRRLRNTSCAGRRSRTFSSSSAISTACVGLSMVAIAICLSEKDSVEKRSRDASAPVGF